MKKMKLLTFAGVAVIATLLLTAGSKGLKYGDWTLAGSWIEMSEDAVTGDPVPSSLVTVSLLDPTQKRFTITTQSIGGEGPTFYGMFPTAVARTMFKGVEVKTGRRTAQWTVVAYGTNAEGKVVYIMVASGGALLTGPDRAETVGAVLAIYGPEQDPFGEEPAAHGCIPYQHWWERIPVVPPVPCEEP